MTPSRTLMHRLIIAILAGAPLLCSGCAEELGPVPMPVARVRGVVRVGRQPVRGGWIEFIPTGETIGNLRSARIRPDGSFEAVGVAVGNNAIRLVDAPVESTSDIISLARMRWATIVRDRNGQVSTTDPARLFVPFSSPIRRTIAAEGSAPLDVDVVSEATKFQEEISRAMSAVPSSPEAAAGEGP